MPELPDVALYVEHLTLRLDDGAVARLHAATRETLTTWIDRLRTETGDRFPEKVTAFRSDFAVHGRYGRPCPACGDPVQRLAYAASEANYCLLRDLPDRRKAPRRPRAVAAPQGRLAWDAGGARGVEGGPPRGLRARALPGVNEKRSPPRDEKKPALRSFRRRAGTDGLPRGVARGPSLTCPSLRLSLFRRCPRARGPVRRQEWRCRRGHPVSSALRRFAVDR